MLCWPHYAEQRANKVFVVDEMKLGVVMEGYDEELVKSEEVEKKVRRVMESDEGEKLRARLASAKEKAAEALAEALLPVEVLRHTTTSTSVTHCGWNSVLEAASIRVPMLCWPQYTEQKANKVFVVDEMKFGVVMEGYDEELVKAEDVEKEGGW
nr:anthocyanidin 5,3-O-glucosyltransferase-like [Aegilops tauschii subsp. strangulata]